MIINSIQRCLSRRLLPRCYSIQTSRDIPLKVCIIGGGPAGFYTAHHLIKKHGSIYIDVLEKLPVPFGLMRFGVAPDHAEVKNCMNLFTSLAKSGQCRFIGNVCLGRDVYLEQLKPFYHAMVMAYGAEDSCKLGIPGEELSGVYSARDFVGWYNGLPEHKNLNPDLSGEEAVVIGQGNVALDVARMLLTPIDILKKTDMCEHALEALAESKVKRVQVVGRRGPLQVAFTIKELREMSKLPSCKTLINPSDFDPIRDLIQVSPDIPKPKRRIARLMMDMTKNFARTKKQCLSTEKEWGLLFLRSPVQILPSTHTGRVEKLRMEINSLELIRSISFKSFHIDKCLPFDPVRGIIPNIAGRVVDENKNPIKGLYCSGWAKTTPIGVLLRRMAFETAEALLDDLEEGNLVVSLKCGDVLDMLKYIPGVDPVSFSEWEAIDEEERWQGNERGKPREKIVNIEKMMHIIRKHREQSY